MPRPAPSPHSQALSSVLSPLRSFLLRPSFFFFSQSKPPSRRLSQRLRSATALRRSLRVLARSPCACRPQSIVLLLPASHSSSVSPLSGPTPQESTSPTHPLELRSTSEEPSMRAEPSPTRRSLAALLASGSLSRIEARVRRRRGRREERKRVPVVSGPHNGDGVHAERLEESAALSGHAVGRAVRGGGGGDRVGSASDGVQNHLRHLWELFLSGGSASGSLTRRTCSRKRRWRRRRLCSTRCCFRKKAAAARSTISA